MRSLKMRSRPEDPVYRYVVKKESEGKSKKSAKIAGLNKFLRIFRKPVFSIILTL